MDVTGSKYCVGVSVGERDGFVLQQKSSAAGFHLKLWNNDMGTISAVLLFSTVCILWSFSLCSCMNAYPVTVELQQLSVLSIKHVDHNESGVFKHWAGKTPPQFLTMLSCSHYCHQDICSRCHVNLNILITWTLDMIYVHYADCHIENSCIRFFWFRSSS